MPPEILFSDGTRVHIKGNLTVEKVDQVSAKLKLEGADNQTIVNLGPHFGKKIVSIKPDQDGRVEGTADGLYLNSLERP